MGRGPPRPTAPPRRSLTLLPSVLLAALLAPAPARASPPVRIGGSGWIADAPTKVADALGFFDDPSPDPEAPLIETRYYGSGKEALDALLAGELELALVATTPLAIALSGEPPSAAEPVILASVALSNQTHSVVADRDRGIESPDDLVGRRVGMPRGTSAEYAWSRFVALHGLDGSSIEVVSLEVGFLAEALLDRRIDAAVLWDPWAADLRSRLEERLTVFSTRSLHTVNWLLVADRAWAREHPDVTDRVLRGFLRAVDLIHREPVRARRLHSEVGGRPPEVLAALEERVIWNVALDWSVLTNMRAQLTWVKQERDEVGGSLASPARYLEPAALDRVAPESVHLPPYLYGGARREGARPP